MNRADAAAELADAAALWSTGQLRAEDVVRAACDALVAGLDGDALRILAAVPYRDARDDVPVVVEAALDELGLEYHAPGSDDGHAAVVRMMSARLLSGAMTPRELAAWAHRTVGHGRLPSAERLVELDDLYDVAEHGSRSLEEVDGDVVAEARRITGARGHD